MNNLEKTHYTLTELAKILGVHRNTLVRAIKQNRIKAEVKPCLVKRRILVTKEEIERILKEREKLVGIKN